MTGFVSKNTGSIENEERSHFPNAVQLHTSPEKIENQRKLIRPIKKENLGPNSLTNEEINQHSLLPKIQPINNQGLESFYLISAVLEGSQLQKEFAQDFDLYNKLLNSLNLKGDSKKSKEKFLGQLSQLKQYNQKITENHNLSDSKEVEKGKKAIASEIVKKIKTVNHGETITFPILRAEGSLFFQIEKLENDCVNIHIFTCQDLPINSSNILNTNVRINSKVCYNNVPVPHLFFSSPEENLFFDTLVKLNFHEKQKEKLAILLGHIEKYREQGIPSSHIKLPDHVNNRSLIHLLLKDEFKEDYETIKLQLQLVHLVSILANETSGPSLNIQSLSLVKNFAQNVAWQASTLSKEGKISKSFALEVLATAEDVKRRVDEEIKINAKSLNLPAISFEDREPLELQLSTGYIAEARPSFVSYQILSKPDESLSEIEKIDFYLGRVNNLHYIYHLAPGELLKKTLLHSIDSFIDMLPLNFVDNKGIDNCWTLLSLENQQEYLKKLSWILKIYAELHENNTSILQRRQSTVYAIAATSVYLANLIQKKLAPNSSLNLTSYSWYKPYNRAEKGNNLSVYFGREDELRIKKCQEFFDAQYSSNPFTENEIKFKDDQEFEEKLTQTSLNFFNQLLDSRNAKIEVDERAVLKKLSENNQKIVELFKFDSNHNDSALQKHFPHIAFLRKMNHYCKCLEHPNAKTQKVSTNYYETKGSDDIEKGVIYHSSLSDAKPFSLKEAFQASGLRVDTIDSITGKDGIIAPKKETEATVSNKEEALLGGIDKELILTKLLRAQFTEDLEPFMLVYEGMVSSASELADPAIQSMFIYLLLQEPLVVKNKADSLPKQHSGVNEKILVEDNLRKALQNFIQSKIKANRGLGETQFDVTLFLFQLGFYLGLSLKDANRLDIAKDFIPIEDINFLIKAADQHKRPLLHLHRLLAYSVLYPDPSKMDIQQIAEVFQSWMGYAKLDVSQKTKIPGSLEHFANTYFFKLIESLPLEKGEHAYNFKERSYLKNGRDSTSSLINQIGQEVQKLYEDVPQHQNWKLKEDQGFPYIQSEKYIVNLMNGDVFVDGIQRITLSEVAFLQEKDFKRLFGDGNSLTFSKDASGLYVGENGSNRYRFIYNGSTLHIQMWVEAADQYYQLVNHPSNNFQHSLKFDHAHWQATEPAKVAKKYFITDLNLNEVYFVKDNQLVCTDDPDVQVSEEIYDFDIKTTFENPSYVTAYQKDEKIERIVFSRHISADQQTLSFTKNEEGQFVWDAQPKYILLQNDPESQLQKNARFKNGLCLEHIHTKKKLLLLPFEKYGNDSFGDKLVLLPSLKLSEKQHRGRFLLFSLDKGEVKPKGIESALYDIYLDYAEGKYDIVNEKINKLDKKKLTSDLSRAILHFILMQEAIHTKEVAAIKLKIKLLLPAVSNVEDLYLDYLKQVEELPKQFLLDKNAERELLQKLSKNRIKPDSKESLLLNNRLLQLQEDKEKSNVQVTDYKQKQQFAEIRWKNFNQGISFEKSDLKFFSKENDNLKAQDLPLKELVTVLKAVKNKDEKLKAEYLLKLKLRDNQLPAYSYIHAHENLHWLALNMLIYPEYYGSFFNKAENNQFISNIETFIDLPPKMREAGIDKFIKDTLNKLVDSLIEEYNKIISKKENENYQKYSPKEIDLKPEDIKPRFAKEEKPHAKIIESPMEFSIKKGDFQNYLGKWQSYINKEKVERPIVSLDIKQEEHETWKVEDQEKLLSDMEYASSLKDSKYEISDENLNDLQASSKEEKKQLKIKQKDKEKELLKLLNKNEEIEKKLKVASGRKENLNFDDAVLCFQSADLASWQKKNKNVTEEDCLKLTELTKEILLYKAEIAQLSRIKNTVNELQNNLNEVEKQQSLKKLYVELHLQSDLEDCEEAIKNWPVKQKAILLSYIGETGVIPYPNQLDLIRTLVQEKDGQKLYQGIIELMMGGGKTSVIATIVLAILAQENDKTITFMVPSSLLRTVYENLNTSFSKAFKKKLLFLDFTSKDLTERFVTKLYEQLKNAIDYGLPIVSYGGILQALRLEFRRLAKLRTLDAGNEDASLGHIQNLAKVIKLYEDHIYLFYDEIDTAWDSLLEMNVPLGSNKQQVDPLRNALMTEIFIKLVDENFLLEDETSIAQKIGLTRNKQTELKEDYDPIKTALATYFSTHSFFNEIVTEDNKEQFINYVQDINTKDEASEEFINWLKVCYEQEDLKAKVDLVDTFKLFLTKVIPAAFELSYNKNYGLQTDKPEEVVPYKGVGVISDTEFGYHWLAAALNYMTAAFIPLEEAQITAILEQKLKEAEQLVADLRVAMDTTPQYKDIELHFDINLDRFGSCSAEDRKELIKHATEFFNSKLKERMLYRKNIVQEEVGYHPEWLSANAIDLANFGTKFGATGTSWNREGYSRFVPEFSPDKGTEAQVFNRMIAKNTKVTESSYESVRDFMIDIVSSLENPKDLSGILEMGGKFRDFGSNLDVVKEIMNFFEEDEYYEQFKHIKEILFFHQNEGEKTPNTLFVLRRGSQEAQAVGSSTVENLSSLNLNPDSYFVLYDQAHNVGVDIAQKTTAVNILTFSEDALSREISQSVMRLRQYAGYQEVVAVISPKDKEILAAKKTDGEEITIKDLIKRSSANQSFETAQHMLRFYSLQIENIFSKSVENTLLNESLKDNFKNNPKVFFDYADQAEDFYIKKMDEEPHKDFGGYSTEDDAKEFLKDKLQTLYQIYRAKVGDSDEIKNEVEELNNYIDKATVLPATVKTRDTANITTEIEQEVVIEVAVKQEVEIDILANHQNLYGYNAYEEKWFNSQISFFDHINDIKNGKSFNYMNQLGDIQTFADYVKTHKATKEFGQIFTNNLFVSYNFTKNDAYKNLSYFDKKHKPPEQILVVQKNDGSQMCLLVSAFEAEKIIKTLKANPEQAKGIKLVAPDQMLIAGDISLENTTDTNKAFMQINVMLGNLSYIVDHLQDFYSWTREYVNGEAKNALKLEFLQLATFANPDTKRRFKVNRELLDYSYDPKVSDLPELFTSQAEFILLKKANITSMEGLTPDKVPMVHSDYVKNIPLDLIKYVTRLQIPSLTFKQLKHLPTEMVKFIPDTTVIKKAKDGQVKYALLEAQIKGLQGHQGNLIKNVNPKLFSAFTDRQYFVAKFLPFDAVKNLNSKFYAFIPKDRLKQLTKEDFELIGKLPESALKHVSINLIEFMPATYYRKLKKEDIEKIEDPDVIGKLDELAKKGNINERLWMNWIHPKMFYAINMERQWPLIEEKSKDAFFVYARDLPTDEMVLLLNKFRNQAGDFMAKLIAIFETHVENRADLISMLSRRHIPYLTTEKAIKSLAEKKIKYLRPDQMAKVTDKDPFFYTAYKIKAVALGILLAIVALIAKGLLVLIRKATGEKRKIIFLSDVMEQSTRLLYLMNLVKYDNEAPKV